MESEIKEVLSGFLKLEPASITRETVIDRSALGNSIMLHRLYAKISQRGYPVADYNTIRTYGQLLERLSGSTNGKNADQTLINNPSYISGEAGHQAHPQTQLGIDIESVQNFEIPADFREHSFYQDNFTVNEIAYCLLQPNPVLSFAGLFAAKEAIIKADNSLLGKPFNQLEIQHTVKGKPFFHEYEISISHAEGMAVAVAFKHQKEKHVPDPVQTPVQAIHQPVTPDKKLVLAALIIAVAALALSIWEYVGK